MVSGFREWGLGQDLKNIRHQCLLDRHESGQFCTREKPWVRVADQAMRQGKHPKPSTLNIS